MSDIAGSISGHVVDKTGIEILVATQWLKHFATDHEGAALVLGSGNCVTEVDNKISVLVKEHQAVQNNL